MIRCEHVGFSYPPVLLDGPPVPVFDALDVAIAPGEFVGVVGPNGAGKTTLLLILAGLAPRLTGGKLRGTVTVTGRVGMVFQEPEGQLFNPTVELEIAWGLENLALPRDEIRARIDHALASFGLAGMAGRAPGTLSGGEKKRLLLAATLAMQPDILLLDEPVSSLDPQGRAEVLDALDRLRAQDEHITVVMAENDSDAVAAFADRVLVLHEGDIARGGPPESVFIDTAWLDAIGAPVPAAARLARALGRDDFVTVEEALKRLGTGARIK